MTGAFLFLAACAAPAPLMHSAKANDSHTASQATAPLPNRNAPELLGKNLPGIGVELQWTAHPGHHGCVLTRRNVLNDAPAQTIRHTEACDTVFVDTDVTPGDVYAYQITTFGRLQGTMSVSDPTPELYVTIDTAESP